MNASSWKKAADLVAKVTPAIVQAPATATVELHHQPIATSTPRATSTESPELSTEAYHQILPGMSS